MLGLRGFPGVQGGLETPPDPAVIPEPAQLEVLRVEGPTGGFQGVEISRVLLAGEKRSTGPPEVLFLKIGFKNLRRDRRGSATEKQNSQDKNGCLAKDHLPLTLAMAALICSTIAAAFSLMTMALSLAPK